MFDSLGNRMKGYENVSRDFLIKRLPVVIRIDGKAFHTFTKGFDRPFDKNFIDCMNRTTEEVCKEVQGFKCAYVQSDEISIITSDLDTLLTSPWFENNKTKIVSVSASIATAYFNYYIDQYPSLRRGRGLAFFDSRAFNLPFEEVENYLLWRQKDCCRNSLFSVAQSIFSHKQLHGKCQAEVHELLHTKNINWTTDYSSHEKNGRFICRTIVDSYKWYEETPNFNTEEFRQQLRNLLKGELI